MNREVSHYVVTAHPPGGVLHTVKCNFLDKDSEVRGLALFNQLVRSVVLILVVHPFHRFPCHSRTS